MNDHKLTVIIPIFNTGQLLSRCINSLLNQSYKNIKIILVNDCSCDNSLEIIKEYAQNYSNINYYSTPNTSGPGYARNIGLQYVTTEYVTFLDSDDWLDTSAYEKTIITLEANKKCDIALFGIKTEFDSPYICQMRYDYKYENIIDNLFALSLLCKTINQDISISSLLGNKVFRTKLIKDNNIFFKQKYFEDNYFSFLTLFHASYIAIIPNIYLHYYQRSDSIMHTFSKKHIENMLNVFYDIKTYLNKKNSFDLYKEYFYGFFNKCIISLMDTLFTTEQNIDVQKKYIIYFFESFLKLFDYSEFIEYMDIRLIKNFFIN